MQVHEPLSHFFSPRKLISSLRKKTRHTHMGLEIMDSNDVNEDHLIHLFYFFNYIMCRVDLK